MAGDGYFSMTEYLSGFFSHRESTCHFNKKDLQIQQTVYYRRENNSVG